MLFVSDCRTAFFGLTRKAIGSAFGTSSCSNSNCFGIVFCLVRPELMISLKTATAVSLDVLVTLLHADEEIE